MVSVGSIIAKALILSSLSMCPDHSSSWAPMISSDSQRVSKMAISPWMTKKVTSEIIIKGLKGQKRSSHVKHCPPHIEEFQWHICSVYSTNGHRDIDRVIHWCTSLALTWLCMHVSLWTCGSVHACVCISPQPM